MHSTARPGREGEDMAASEVSRSRGRQAAALSAAEQRCVADTRTTRTKIAGSLDMSVAQYTRYLTGETPLRVEQIELFAAAYGLSETVLAHAIVTGDLAGVGDPYDMAADLKGHILDRDIPEFVAHYAALDPADQRSAADGAKRMANRARNATQRDNHGA